MLRLFAFLGLVLCSVPSNAATVPPRRPVSVMGDPGAQLVLDSEKKTVRILIDGKEVGRFEKDGLHVTGFITFTQATNPLAGQQPNAPPKAVSK